MIGLSKLPRRTLDAIALRFSEAEKRLADFNLVKAPPLIEGMIEIGAIKIYNGVFNPEWIRELNILPKVIFDVGSFDAGTAGLLRQSFPDASIFSFEADPQRFKIVCENAIAFKVTPVDLAIGDHDGTIEWYPSKNGGNGSCFRHTEKYKQQYGETVQMYRICVPCLRLDTFCNQNNISKIDFMHVDVEGAEYELLLGLGAMRPSLIFLETISRGLWAGAKSSGQLHRLLSKMGYCIAGDFRSDRLYIHHSASSCI